MESPPYVDIPPKREIFDLEEELRNSLNSNTPFSITSSPESQASTTPSAASSASPEPASQASQEQAAPEKKPVKKRKSWGQELPVPTTNLPPRKRAKTEAEKEQRRIERVLRNRAAAQSSRERKRKEVEALEDVKNKLAEENKQLHTANKELVARVETILAQNHALQLEIKRMKEKWESINGTPYKSDATSSPPPLQPLLTPTSITHDSFAVSPSEISTPPSTDGTLDPSHLSTPCKTEEDPFSMTQHTAVMLCPKDLPCQLTGPSLEAQVILAIMRWTLCLVSAISLGPLLEIVMYLVTSQQIPDSELTRLFPLIRLLATLTTTQSLVSRLRTLSPTCALLLDATSSVRWFETTANELGLSKWITSIEDEVKDEDPARACRRFVMGLSGKGGMDYGPVVGKGEELMCKLAESIKGRDGFDFNEVLSMGRPSVSAGA
ncbi:hypothetical protein BDZ91DRAFT_804579 [Kalaharituber pfeilii]|nr:hypothetical protein BDZ91DRAFT_804579 [Kalaharituber pfeilii]